MEKGSRILVTGAGGLVGSGLVDHLKKQGYTNVRGLRSGDCDLTDSQLTAQTFRRLEPEYVFHIAGHVYGIMGNMKNQGLSFYRNAMININTVEASREVGVRKIVAMGSGCVYPYPSPGLPLREEMVWKGEPHHSEYAYAHAKRAMLAQLEAYRESYGTEFAYVISGNLFGPNDKFDADFGHVVPSLVRKFYEARKSGGQVSVWGNGSAQRDFLYRDDVSAALEMIMLKVSGPVNMGSGKVHSIREIVDFLTEYTQMQGRVSWDSSKPNGQDYRAYDLTKLVGAGFVPRFSLSQGLKLTFDWYQEHADAARK